MINISSSLPQGAGVSSSAALSVGLLSLCYKVNQIEVDPLVLAQDAQSIEHKFAAVNCGLMDQLAITSGIEGEFTKIDFLNRGK